LRPRAREPDRKAAQDRGSRRNATPGARDGPPAADPQDRSYPSAADADPAAPPELPPSPIHPPLISDRESQPKRKRQFPHTLESGNDKTPRAIPENAHCLWADGSDMSVSSLMA